MLGHTGILYILVATECMVSGGGEGVPVIVNGLINRSITLSLPEDPSRPVQKAFWNFRGHTMATYTNNQLDVINSEFEGRLEIVDNGRALRMRQLRLQDSGIYSVTLPFADKTRHDASYNLTVYEPVPTPSVTIEERKIIGERCNVTLRCAVPPNTLSLSYTWKYRNNGSDYQLYNNSGSTIQMSLTPESWNMEVLCIVHNPADKKNDSLHEFCQHDYHGKGRQTGKGEQGRGYYGFLAFLLVPLVFLGWYLIAMKKKRRKEPQTTYQQEIEEIHYAELNMAPAPSNDSTQVPKKDSNPRVEESDRTVYSALSHL